MLVFCKLIHKSSTANHTDCNRYSAKRSTVRFRFQPEIQLRALEETCPCFSRQGRTSTFLVGSERNHHCRHIWSDKQGKKHPTFQENRFNRKKCQWLLLNEGRLNQFQLALFRHVHKRHQNKENLVSNLCHCGYPSESELDPKREKENLTRQPHQSVILPELEDLEPHFSDQEEVISSETLQRPLLSTSGSSAPLLNNPSLTVTLSNFPLFRYKLGSQIPGTNADDMPPENFRREVEAPPTNSDLPQSSREQQKWDAGQKIDLQVVLEAVLLIHAESPQHQLDQILGVVEDSNVVQVIELLLGH